MVDKNDLRAQLSAHAEVAISIDTAEVISRSRKRRRPRQIAVGTAGVLAAASLVFATVNAVPLFAPDSTSLTIMADEASGSYSESDAAESGEVRLAPETPMVDEICGTTVPAEAVEPYGLVLELDLPAQAQASGSASGSVRLTNASNAVVTGTTASIPDLHLVRDSVSISHSPDVQILSVMPVNLQPGQSIEFAVSIELYDCTMLDPGGMLAPGTYALSGSIGFVPDDVDAHEAAEVRSALVPITLN